MHLIVAFRLINRVVQKSIFGRLTGLQGHGLLAAHSAMKVLDLQWSATAGNGSLLLDPLRLAAARRRNRDLVAGALHCSIFVRAAIAFYAAHGLSGCEELLSLLVVLTGDSSRAHDAGLLRGALTVLAWAFTWGVQDAQLGWKVGDAISDFSAEDFTLVHHGCLD